VKTRPWAFACLLLAVAFSVHAEKRVALVIGNGTYQHTAHLPNPVHDAKDVAAALQRLHYSVQLVTDSSKAGMEAALVQFARSAAGADQVLIYYAGHGIEAGGVNYLLPVEARVESQSTVRLEAVSLAALMDIASEARHLGLVVLDACRNNPLANNIQAHGRGAGRGLAGVEPAGSKLLVAYATRDGRTAADGAGRNSPYTAAILETLQEPGLEVRVFWGKVHDRVLSATRNAQEPFIYGALGGEQLYLNSPTPASGSNQPAAPQRAASDQTTVELALWHSVEKLGTVDAYRAYLTQYPKGQFSKLAKLQIAALSRPAAGGTAEPSRRCAECPEMVNIPAGSFLMGSPGTETGRSDSESPQHKVHIGAFEVSKNPVTRGQWRIFANETGQRSTKNCDSLNPGFPQDDRHPAVCMNWQEAQDYIAWLNRKSGQHFRLLTEAEYEYVNRAGTQTAYFWGESDADLAQHANSNGKGTTPVGSFPANSFGLFDTTGNVWSWTQDCWHKDYHGAPTDGSAWETGCDSSARVVRGSSWTFYAKCRRSACRFGNQRGYRDGGLRLARTTS
jgi:formylglycine-generating enzyme required for sulfatase activity